MITASNTAVFPHTILVVDDTPQNLTLMSNLLKEHYTVKVASTGARALKIAQSTLPDLILLDIMMPDIDGYEVCRQLKENPETKDIPVIFLTAKSEVADEQHGFDLGAVDYITKPISPPIVLSRVRTHIIMKESVDFLRDRGEYLEQEITRRTKEITDLQDITVLTMASLAETRDPETGSHILRTQHYVKVLAETLQSHPLFSSYLDSRVIDLLFKSAPLHDIGKVGIPDHILLKPGRLTDEEFEIMRTHTTLGRNAIESAEKRLGKNVPFLQYAKEIAYCHHEKWDGSGYPNGLVGDQIPISGRLMAIADVYDALISRRVYKEPMSHGDTTGLIIEGRGKHFDPNVVDAFLEKKNVFHEIFERYAPDS